MATNTKIEWTHHTFNPWRGCTKVSPGCANCYAEAGSKRNPAVLGEWGPHGKRVLAAGHYWRLPLKWDQEARIAGERRRVFCASLADVFEDWRGDPEGVGQLTCHKTGELLSVNKRGHIWPMGWPSLSDGDDWGAREYTMDDARQRLFALIRSTPNLDWLLLTKRPDRMRDWVYRQTDTLTGAVSGGHFPRDLSNVWLGVSVEDQQRAEERIPLLLQTPAAVRFLSCEPLLGPINLTVASRLTMRNEAPQPRWIRQLDWVIVGGESGYHARPMHPDWARSIRDQCQTAGVAFFFKQWGEWAQYSVVGTQGLSDAEILGSKMAWMTPKGRISVATQRPEDFTEAILMSRVGKHAAGRLLDGREWNEFPKVEQRT